MAWDLWKIAKNERAMAAAFEGTFSHFESHRNAFVNEKRLPYYRDVMKPIGILGQLFVLGGNASGWTQIERSVRGEILNAIQDIHRHEKWLQENGDSSPKGRMISYYADVHAFGWLGAMAFQHVRGASFWADRMIRELNTDGPLLEPKFLSDHYVLCPFVLELHCRVFGGTVRLKGKWHPQWKVFQAVLDNWDAPSGTFAKVLLPLCQFHIENCSDRYGKDAFLWPERKMMPYEVLALRRLRELKGLDFPEVDHPLITGNPLARLPDSWERFEGDELEVAFLKIAQEQYPEFVFPFDTPKTDRAVTDRELVESMPPLQRPAKKKAGKAVDTIKIAPLPQSKHQPAVVGERSANATFSAEFCNAIGKELGCTAKELKEAISGQDVVDADTLGNLLAYSKHGIVFDWRDPLSVFFDALEPIARKLRVKMTVELNDEDDAAVVEFLATGTGKKKAAATAVAVRYSANGEESLHDVAGSLQSASAGRLLLLPLRDSLESDTFCYIVVSPTKLEELRTKCGERFDELFATVA